MTINSFAKINLGLHITQKRHDNYHNIETLFQLISFKDTIHIKESEIGFKLKSIPQICPEDETNLVFKAVDQICKKASIPTDFEITLYKNIPPGAGLGGGSSNAAATLLELNKTWNCGLSQTEILDIAARLGSDVPFFIYGGLAFGEGRGEKLTPILKKPDYHGVLILNDMHISTQWAYQNFKYDLTKSLKNSNFKSFISSISDLESWRYFLKNDLESVVFTKHPELNDQIGYLYNSGAFFAQMSGSGSSIFGLYKSKETAKNASDDLEKKKYKTVLFKPIYET